MENETMIGSFCRLTGISQRSLASYLNTNQSQLSRMEARQRALPTAALLKMVDLYTKALAVANNPIARPAAENPDALKEKADWCLAQCHPLQKQLEAMQLSYQQAITTLWLMEAEEKDNTNLPNKKQGWIDEQRYRAQQQLAASGWLPQRALAIKIALLQHEAQLWQQGMEENI